MEVLYNLVIHESIYPNKSIPWTKGRKKHPAPLLTSQNATIPRAEAPDVCRKRDLCLQELVETEHNYVEALNMLCRKFLEPLRRVLNEEQIMKIFGEIPVSYWMASLYCIVCFTSSPSYRFCLVCLTREIGAKTGIDGVCHCLRISFFSPFLLLCFDIL